MIKDMKTHILKKLKNRYTKNQETFLSICALLDVRYKTGIARSFDIEVFKENVVQICKDDVKANSSESQHIFYPTQGKERISLTCNSIVSAQSRPLSRGGGVVGTKISNIMSTKSFSRKNCRNTTPPDTFIKY